MKGVELREKPYVNVDKFLAYREIAPGQGIDPAIATGGKDRPDLSSRVISLVSTTQRKKIGRGDSFSLYVKCFLLIVSFLSVFALVSKNERDTLGS